MGTCHRRPLVDYERWEQHPSLSRSRDFCRGSYDPGSKGDLPQERLNELEYVKGEIFANIWKTDWVARIDPASGSVVGMIDFSYLLPAADRTATTDVLNGIAYDPAGDRLFVTGKNWPKLFEVRLKKK